MWTPTALASEAVSRSGTAWRAVEFQYATSTRKLVATKLDQELLEDVLESSKPPVARAAACLHYLLKTPFRYDAPYPVESRFRLAGTTEGVFYASEHIRTALAEIYYYRLRFFAESPCTVLPLQQERLTVFSIGYRSLRVIDLTQPPFAQERTRWADPADYTATQKFADTARAAGMEIIRYESVRDIESGTNLVLLAPEAFSSRNPKELQTWFLFMPETEANCERANANGPEDLWTFQCAQFGL